MLTVKTSVPYELINGTIESIDPGESVTILYKPPRRQLPSRKKVAWSDFIASKGAVGEVGTIALRTNAATLFSGDGDFSSNGGTIDEAELNFNAALAHVEVHDDKVEEGSSPKKTTKKAAGKPRGKPTAKPTSKKSGGRRRS